MNFKIQMLAGNKFKICVSAGFEISSTLAYTWTDFFRFAIYCLRIGHQRKFGRTDETHQ